eukprot:15353113-Ditylum_brightwellii.AAC.1
MEQGSGNHGGSGLEKGEDNDGDVPKPLLLERCNVQDDVDDVRHFFPLSLAALLLWVKVFKYIISYFSFLVYLTSILLFYVKCVLLGVSKSTHA